MATLTVLRYRLLGPHLLRKQISGGKPIGNAELPSPGIEQCIERVFKGDQCSRCVWERVDSQLLAIGEAVQQEHG